STCSMARQPAGSAVFPYTTLFRSELQRAGAEAEECGWAASEPSRGHASPGLFDLPPAEQDPPQVGGCDVVPQGSPVVAGELGYREFRWGERESDVGVGEFGAQPLPGRAHHGRMVEGHRRQV